MTGPRAAPPYWPYRDHRTMKQVLEDEARERFMRLPTKHRAGRTVKDFAG